MVKEDFCVFLDAGHGSLDKNGNYVTAPSKQFEHAKGTFHKGKWFFEGVWNRVLTNRVAAKLNNLGIANIIVSHEYVDISLEYRVDMANWYHKNFKNGLYISNHSNAGGGSARGFEVYTTPGKTASDEVAEMHWNNVKDLLGNRIAYRPDGSDSDNDREANFYVLKRTAMPAILVEHLFFDNFEDASLLMDDEIVERFAEAQVRTVIQYMKK
ncbi:MAG TPA: N-acetylmuramoyl-L-alanine amidase [Saprospiraceae bacterium]|nr:N-acetylmuramoyl-L-alanine amidase [Saprospiraceae bacterium]HMQ85660.1 N-acetylmuramoyl-L-alanine amidase [Saprospiraceae bacterium]